MPELPEVEALARRLRDDGLEGAWLRSAEIVRPLVTRPQDAGLVERLSTGVKIKRLYRRAKNLLFELSNKHTLRIHLGMTGDVSIEPESYEQTASVRAQWTITGKRRLIFTDMRALGRVHVLTAQELKALFDQLGLEPLSDEFTKEHFLSIARRSKLPAKLFLMDQTKVAGLGNIYAAEALFRARVSPTRAISSLSTVRLNTLRGEIRNTLEAAVHSIYTAHRGAGGYQDHRDDFKRFVYGRKGEPCLRCNRPIRKLEQGGRSTYYCAYCQR